MKKSRDISEEHWRLSFERYFGKGVICGYCADAVDASPETFALTCLSCVVDNKICADRGGSGYFYKMFKAKTPKTRLKYKNLIRAYIIDEGRRLGYSTPDDEKVVREVGGG